MAPIRPIFAAALLCSAPLASAQAQAEVPQPLQRIRIVMGSHLPQPADLEQTYAASCKDAAYRLVVTPGSKSVVLKASTLKDVDLSDTPLARQLLDRDVITKVGFNCPMGALNIFLEGFITEDLEMPKAYRLHMSVRHDGTVRSDEGVRIVDLDSFGTPRGPVVREIKPRAEPARN